MTNIKLFKNEHKTLGFIISGHSGYSIAGSDIVCSAISSLSQMVCVGLENVLNLKPSIKIKDGYLECFVPKNLGDDGEKVQFLFDSFEKSVELLLLGDKKLKKYINLEVKNEIY